MKNTAIIKQKILEFYSEAPIKRWAADYAGVSEDTLANWEKKDSAFSAHLRLLKAEYGRQRLNKVKNSEWVLERMFNSEFKDKSELYIEHGAGTNYIEFIEDNPSEKTLSRK